jgi:hypothetical protein
MLPSLPWYTAPVVFGLGMLLLTLAGLTVARGARAAGLDDGTRRRVTSTALLFLLTWFVLSAIVARPLASLDPDSHELPLSFPIFLGGGVLMSLLALSIPAWRRTVEAIPVSTLVGLQFYRIIGALFLLLLAAGVLPAQFAQPAGWGDIAVALAAPLVALALNRHLPGGRALAVVYSVLGLFDLVMAVGLGTGRLLPLIHPGAVPTVAGPMGVFPLAIIPTFGVPIAVILHLYALRALLGRRDAATRRVGEVAPATR